MGFAVVANEIRKLADHSRKSTDEIAVILQNILLKTNALDNRIKNSQTVFTASGEAAEQAEQIFHAIYDNSAQVTVQAKEIYEKTQTLQEASDGIVTEMSSIAGITEESSAAAEQIFAGVDEQRALVQGVVTSFEKLERLIHDLEVLVSSN